MSIYTIIFWSSYTYHIDSRLRIISELNIYKCKTSPKYNKTLQRYEGVNNSKIEKKNIQSIKYLIVLALIKLRIKQNFNETTYIT